MAAERPIYSRCISRRGGGLPVLRAVGGILPLCVVVALLRPSMTIASCNSLPAVSTNGIAGIWERRGRGRFLTRGRLAAAHGLFKHLSNITGKGRQIQHLPPRVGPLALARCVSFPTN